MIPPKLWFDWLRKAIARRREHRCDICGSVPTTPCNLYDASGKEYTQYLCFEHARNDGYCWSCGGFFAGTREYDIQISWFGEWTGMCNNCREDDDEWDDEWEEELDEYDSIDWQEAYYDNTITDD